MQHNLVKLMFICIIGMILSLSSPGFGADNSDGPLKPVKQADGRRWRIGYMEGGPYRNYQSLLKAFIVRLAEMGWMESKPFPETENDAETRTIWKWLSEDVQSDFLKFRPGAYWTGNWDQKQREQNKQAAIKRFNTAKDIDLMLAFGTWAGLDLANNLHAVPTMLFSSSDPIRAGIVKSASDSGYDHFHACVDPDRYKRQIRVFHEAVGFKKLGIAFEDTPVGRSYAALDDVHRAARELGFKVIECSYPRSEPFSEQKEKIQLLACHRSLAKRGDAFYLTTKTAVTVENLPELLKPFFEYKIPTFSQGRTFEVRHGVLMSLAPQSDRVVAKFHAKVFTRILNGEKPRDIPQVFEEKQEIVLNLETAKRIGFRFPLDILAGAKEIYEHIAGSQSSPQ